VPFTFFDGHTTTGLPTRDGLSLIATLPSEEDHQAINLEREVSRLIESAVEQT
jgi:hypothetical protein